MQRVLELVTFDLYRSRRTQNRQPVRPSCAPHLEPRHSQRPHHDQGRLPRPHLQPGTQALEPRTTPWLSSNASPKRNTTCHPALTAPSSTTSTARSSPRACNRSSSTAARTSEPVSRGSPPVILKPTSSPSNLRPENFALLAATAPASTSTSGWPASPPPTAAPTSTIPAAPNGLPHNR